MELPQTSLDKLTAAFKALGVQAPSLLTKIGILRSLIIEIDSAKKDGYSYGLILETLIANGLKKTTLNQFYGLMNRIRLERGFTNLANQSAQKIAPDLLDSGKQLGKKEGGNENLNETNPLRKLSGSRKPGEFNPIPTAKIEFD